MQGPFLNFGMRLHHSRQSEGRIGLNGWNEGLRCCTKSDDGYLKGLVQDLGLGNEHLFGLFNDSFFKHLEPLGLLV
jgi:hypothetical protein